MRQREETRLHDRIDPTSESDFLLIVIHTRDETRIGTKPRIECFVIRIGKPIARIVVVFKLRGGPGERVQRLLEFDRDLVWVLGVGAQYLRH